MIRNLKKNIRWWQINEDDSKLHFSLNVFFQGIFFNVFFTKVQNIDILYHSLATDGKKGSIFKC